MKKTILMALLLTGGLSQTNAFSQAKNREIGLKTSNLTNYRLIYKQERKTPGKYLRFDAGANINFRNTYDSNAKHNTFGSNISLRLGFENRINLSEKFELIHGLMPNLKFGFQYDKINPSQSNFPKTQLQTITAQIGLGYIVGAQYNINEHFSIGAEIIPSLNVGYSNSRTNSAPNLPISSINQIFSNINITSAAGLFLMYKFNK